MNTSPVTNCSF